jgi:3-oxoacyl-(acyl-carrier-protein) synthase
VSAPPAGPAVRRPRPRLRPTYVAGRGAVTGFGSGCRRLLAAIRAGETAVLPRRRTAALDVPTEVAAEITASDLDELGGVADLAFAVACRAAREALAEAGDPAPGAIGLVLSSTKADLSGIYGPGEGLGLPSRLAARIAAELGLRGVLGALSCACASGVSALSYGARHLTCTEDERVLVLGVDLLHEFILTGFGALNALDPRPCRPFDLARRGVSLGEGAAAMLLSVHPDESVGAALVGHGAANDACHVTGPDRQGAGLALAARRALAGADLVPGDIDLIHLHGTATPANDTTEALGLCTVFGGRTPPAFGTKAQTGHTLGAAGIVETIIAIDALQRGLAPANVALERPDVDPGLDLVRTPRALARPRHALKVASGFGGFQGALVLSCP